MTNLAFETLRQRADYTHKYNLKTGRHGWLRLTPAYSVRVVEELIDDVEEAIRVFDPFCGTATTALSAAYRGHDATTIDINPFLVWLGKAKTAYYSDTTIKNTRRACTEILSLLNRNSISPSSAPPIHNIERWWTPSALRFLCHLQAAIDTTVNPTSDEAILLRVAFCRTLIACSNASFNHQSMSFKNEQQSELTLIMNYEQVFQNDVAFVLNGAVENPEGESCVLLHDARHLATLATSPFDLVITSPPYANRMSYIRELRPYMYWLRFLTNGRDAGELDWLAIGGTWGIATSRLSEWKPDIESYGTRDFENTLSKIASPTNANGALLATYIRKYCVDMAKHFDGLRSLLSSGARLHYIVGNSMFYGELLPVEQIYANIMHELGFTQINIRPIRKRNSKKALIEFDVSARY